MLVANYHTHLALVLFSLNSTYQILFLIFTFSTTLFISFECNARDFIYINKEAIIRQTRLLKQDCFCIEQFVRKIFFKYFIIYRFTRHLPGWKDLTEFFFPFHRLDFSSYISTAVWSSMDGKLSNSCSKIIRFKNLFKHWLTCHHFSLIKCRVNGSNVAYIYTSVCILGDWISIWIDAYSVFPTWFHPPQLWSLLFVTLSAGRHHVTIAPPTLLSPATSVNPVKRFRRFVRRVERRRSFARSFAFASLGVSSRWSVAVVSCRRCRRLATAYPFN